MSIDSLTQQLTVSLLRRVVTQGTAGGKGSESYTAAARGSLLTSTTCRGSTMRATENQKLGVRGDRLVWKFLFSVDPQLTTQDMIQFTDNASATRQCRCLHRSEDLDMQGRLFRVLAEDVSSED